VNCELIQETSYLHPVSSQESVRDKTQIHSRSLADIADHTLRERMPVPNISRKTMPLLPDVGVMALVPDEWSAPWQTRHHVLSRLARYFQVVWVDPAQEWREVLKQRQERTRKSSALGEASGLEVYTPEFWLPKFYRPAFLAQTFLSLALASCPPLPHASRLSEDRFVPLAPGICGCSFIRGSQSRLLSYRR